MRTVNQPGGLAAAVALHEQLLRRPDPGASATRLHPGRRASPSRWTPDLLPLRPYQSVDPAQLELGGHDDFHAIPDTALDGAIERVVDVEGPVHFEVLADRLLDAAGVGRLGSRIRARIEGRLEVLSAGPSLQWQADCLARPARTLEPPYRDWRAAPEKTRQLEYVSDNELMLALFRAVLDGDADERETVMNAGIHAIGFIRLTDNARERLQAPFESLLASGWLVAQGNALRAGGVEPADA